MNKVTNIVWRDSGSNVLAGFRHLYDNANMITNVAMSDFQSQHLGFSYNSLNWLTAETSASVSSTSVVSLAYDLAENRTAVTCNGTNTAYTLDLGNRLACSASADINATYL